MSEWISVESLMPENSEKVKKYSDAHMEFCTVLACGRACTGSPLVVKETNRFVNHKTGIKYLDEIVQNEGREFDKWYWSDYWAEVTHWMALPEPPIDNE